MYVSVLRPSFEVVREGSDFEEIQTPKMQNWMDLLPFRVLQLMFAKIKWIKGNLTKKLPFHRNH